MEQQRRKEIRLKGYDYSTAGAYFVTVCTYNRRCLLSKIVGEGLAPPVVKLTEYGEIVQEEIERITLRYPSIQIDHCVIMPNHIHLLVSVRSPAGGASPSPTLMDVVRVFKSRATRRCDCGGQLFQRSFYDHVVRGEKDYLEIWEYIENNAAKWREDRFYEKEVF